MKKNTPRIRVGEARSKLREFEGPTGQSTRRFDEVTCWFERFLANGFGIEVLSEVSHEHVEAFVRAKGSTGEPSPGTMHLRRTSLRLLFRIARIELGTEGDPTIDVILPPKTGMAARPLTTRKSPLAAASRCTR